MSRRHHASGAGRGLPAGRKTTWEGAAGSRPAGLQGKEAPRSTPCSPRLCGRPVADARPRRPRARSRAPRAPRALCPCSPPRWPLEGPAPPLPGGGSPPLPTAVPRRRLTAGLRLPWGYANESAGSGAPIGPEARTLPRKAGPGARHYKGERAARHSAVEAGSAVRGRSEGNLSSRRRWPHRHPPGHRPATGSGTGHRGRPAPTGERPRAAREALPAASPVATPELAA